MEKLKDVTAEEIILNVMRHGKYFTFFFLLFLKQ